MGLTDVPSDLAQYAERLRRVTVGSLEPLARPVEIADPDPAWPVPYEREAERIRQAPGDGVARRAHAGSTSVPGLLAKPTADSVLEVADAADEPADVPALEGTRYILGIRESDGFEHRLFKGSDTNVSVHVLSAGTSETDRMLAPPDRPRRGRADRDL